MFLSWRIRWETVWAVSCQCSSSTTPMPQLAYHRAPSLSINWSALVPVSPVYRVHTGVGVRRRSVSLITSCGLALIASCGLAFINICWVGRIIIMRVGCIRSALEALNMLYIVWRVSWSGECRAVVNCVFRHRDVGEARGLMGCSGPEKSASLIGCGGQCAERSPRPPSPTSLRHDPLSICHCRHFDTEHAPRLSAIMSDNENGNDGGEEMVTKPFKFVTGESCPAPPLSMKR